MIIMNFRQRGPYFGYSAQARPTHQFAAGRIVIVSYLLSRLY